MRSISALIGTAARSSARTGQRAAEAADRGANGVADKYVTH